MHLGAHPVSLTLIVQSAVHVLVSHGPIQTLPLPMGGERNGTLPINPDRMPCREYLFHRLCLLPGVSWKDSLRREAVRTAKRAGRDYVRGAREEKEKMGERATQAASKSTKDDSSISNDEAADLVEEARDSAIDEVKKEQSQGWLLIFGLVIFYLYYMSP